MSVKHSQAAAQAATDAIVDLVDGGDCQILDGATVLATIDLEATAFGAAAADGSAAIEEGTGLSAAASGTGTADSFRFRNAAKAMVWQGKCGLSHAITGVSTGSKTFSVATDITGLLTVGERIRVAGSTGNDGWYTIVSMAFDAPNTVITVVETPADATVDGTLHPFAMTIQNTSINAGQTISLASYSYNAGQTIAT